MRIVFRLDASVRIGNGHLARCLALADQFKELGCEILFICRPESNKDYESLFATAYEVRLLQKKTNTIINKKSYSSWLSVDWEQDVNEVIQIIDNIDADLLIVDHYGIDARWHNKVRDYCKKIFVIDDLADRHLDCDFLLNSSFTNEDKDYKKFISNKDCISFLGPNYALIQPKFSNLRLKAKNKREHISSIQEILIFMGSMDPDNYSSLAINAINQIDWKQSIIVNCILDSHSPSLEKVSNDIESLDLRASIHSNTSDMEKLIYNADLAIGSGGNSAWERCVLGLPTLLTSIAPNQQRNITGITESGAAIYWDSTEDLLTVLESCNEDINYLISMQEKAFDLCDGLGTKRITESIMKEFSSSLLSL
jgi:UDP-2,4-diacetamido-2,4,6-trideoxy-beta-L-altropyranose hydrolase